MNHSPYKPVFRAKSMTHKNQERKLSLSHKIYALLHINCAVKVKLFPPFGGQEIRRIQNHRELKSKGCADKTKQYNFFASNFLQAKTVAKQRLLFTISIKSERKSKYLENLSPQKK